VGTTGLLLINGVLRKGVDLMEIIFGYGLISQLIKEEVWLVWLGLLLYSITRSIIHYFFGEIVSILCQFFESTDEFDDALEIFWCIGLELCCWFRFAMEFLKSY
jgi:hypothetical protein